MGRTLPTAGMSPIDVYSTAVRPCGYFEHVFTDDGTERHTIEIVSTATMASGGNYAGLNIAVTTAGTAATWVSPLYCKVTQGTTKNVNGYLCAAEFEVVNGAANVSDNFVLVLNYQNNGSGHGSHESYIALRDYGSLAANSFLWIADATVASGDATALVSSKTSAAVSHTLRIIVGSTNYWIMLSNAI